MALTELSCDPLTHRLERSNRIILLQNLYPPTDALRPIIPDNTRIPRITAAAGTKLADAYSKVHVNPSLGFFPNKRSLQSLGPSFLHAVLLHQACAHCEKFPTAASRRSQRRVSVPVWRIILSNPLRIDALVGLYPTN